MEPLRIFLEPAVPATITLKNIPDSIHLALKRAAESNHRSLNGEVIARLEQTLAQRQDRAHEHLACAQQLRESFSPPTILKMKKMDAVTMIRADRDRR